MHIIKTAIALLCLDDDPQRSSPPHSDNIKKVKLPLEEIFLPPSGWNLSFSAFECLLSLPSVSNNKKSWNLRIS